MKTCIKCQEQKDLNNFRLYKTRIINTCKVCESTISAAWKKENREKSQEYILKYKERGAMLAKDRYQNDAEYRSKLLARARARYLKFSVRKLLDGARRRAKESGVPFNICEQDIVVPECCPVFGVTLVISQGQPSDNSPSLDRIIPELGYVKGNVRVISYLANRMKSNATPEQLKTFAKWILNDS